MQGGDASDTNGHGTMTAGAAAGLSVGAAPGAKVYAARVIDAAGYISADAVIAALNAVVGHADPIKIASISLGSSSNAALDSAVQAAVAAGVVVTVAAGNGATDACTVSPGELLWCAGEANLRHEGDAPAACVPTPGSSCISFFGMHAHTVTWLCATVVKFRS